MASSSGCQGHDARTALSLSRLVLLHVALTASVSSTAVSVALAQTQPVRISDTAELGRFTDTFFEREMRDRRVPGAVIVVVHEGRTILQRGYGLADVQLGKPVDPNRTLFRVGSISKVFTATAAMQLAAAGRLELHTDIISYTGSISIPEKFRQPITLHHLLTHTSGFEERLVGMAAPPGAAPQSIERFLSGRIPSRVRPPGYAVSYSNHGSTLAGLLVERASGLPFHEYVRLHVLEPIGMQRSGFRPSPEAASEIAQGYEVVGDAYRPIPLDLVGLEPAGAFLATGADMSRFIAALLGDGPAGAEAWLPNDTRRLMQTPHAGDTAVASFTYGFYASTRIRRPLLIHTGGWRDFKSLLFLLPSERIGVFLSYNRADEGPLEMQEAYMQEFLERYAEPARITPAESLEAPRRNFHGTYRYIRHAHSTPEKIIALFGSHVKVREGSGDTLVASGLAPEPVRLTPAGGAHYLRDDGRGRIAFDVDSEGGVRLTAGPDLPTVFQRLAWWEDPSLHIGIVMLAALLFLSAVVRLPIAAISTGRVRRRTADSAVTVASNGGGAERGWYFAAAASALHLTLIVVFPIAFLGKIVGGIPQFVYGMPPLASAVLVLPWIAFVLTLGALACTVALWRNRRGSRASLVHFTMVVFALAVFAPFLFYWRLVAGVA